MPTKERPLVTKDERQRPYRGMERQQPELWSRLYPRHYPDPPTCGEYYAAEDPAHFFLWQYYRADHSVGVAAQPLMTMATGLMECGFPMMWISPTMVEAIQPTLSPANLDWTKMVLAHLANAGNRLLQVGLTEAEIVQHLKHFLAPGLAALSASTI